jgi:soluble lytic murein transglycosylase-like protein
VRAVAGVESSFRADAVSPKGAQGLMQLMPDTARALGVQDPFDAEENLDGGTRHLKALIERYDGNLTKALAAYNAGEGAVARHGGVPPYRETRDYVSKVLRRYKQRP